MTKYRADIDGLRAVAVLPVLLFHANQAWMPGGFLGVDIFFVISGYLITAILLSEVTERRFTFSGFYARRARRLGPALMAMLAATLLMAWLTLESEQLRDASHSAVAATWGLGNVYYWLTLTSGYFSEATDTTPLLHTWSLGVEEQFYMFAPPLLIALVAISRGRTWPLIACLSLIAVVSFAYAESAAASAPSFAYYMLPSRAGELVVGSLLATGLRVEAIKNTTRSSSMRQITGFVGACLILYGFIGVDRSTVFPGLSALPTVAGTALVIFSSASGKSVVGHILSWRPFVLIGLISYSLYLWHWPVLSFARILFGSLTLWMSVSALVLSLLLAWLSYRWLEIPTRTATGMRRGRAIMLFFIGPAILITLAGFCIHAAAVKQIEKRPAEMAQRLLEIEERTRSTSDYNHVCQLDDKFTDGIFDDPRCETRHSDKLANILLAGDSNAAHYVGFVESIAQAGEFSIRNSALSTCPPVFGDTPYGMPRYRDACTTYRKSLEALIRTSRFEVIILGAQWQIHTQAPGFWDDLDATVKALTQAGRKIVILEQVPIFDEYERFCERLHPTTGSGQCRLHSRQAAPQSMSVNRELRERYAGRPDVTLLGAEEVLCKRGVCNAYLDDLPAYYSASHLSMDGSERIGAAYLASNSIPSVLADAGTRQHDASYPACQKATFVGVGRYIDPFDYQVGGIGTQFSVADSLYGVVEVAATNSTCLLSVSMTDKSSPSSVRHLTQPVQPGGSRRVTVVMIDGRTDALSAGTYDLALSGGASLSIVVAP